VRLVTVLGTRPEIIRLARIIPLLDDHAEHLLIHTGQNRDPRLSDIFFSDLGVRQPDVHLGIVATSFGEQVAQIIQGVESELLRIRPDRLLILGDTNSGLAAFVACRMGIPVYHLEAGNRCFDDRVPEEVNRRVIDHSSSVLLPYTERSRANLRREGIASDRIFVVGNPILEVLESQRPAISASDIHARLGVERGGFFLVTTHRQENVDDEDRLRSIIESLLALVRTYDTPLVWAVHPRTSARLESFGLGATDSRLIITEPLGFADFVALEGTARCVLSDSGTVQEECCILRIPNVTLRDVTERPETLECGSNILSGVAPDDVLRTVALALARPPAWTPPAEYMVRNVSETVARVVLGYGPSDRSPRTA